MKKIINTYKSDPLTSLSPMEYAVKIWFESRSFTNPSCKLVWLINNRFELIQDGFHKVSDHICFTMDITGTCWTGQAQIDRICLAISSSSLYGKYQAERRDAERRDAERSDAEADKWSHRNSLAQGMVEENLFSRERLLKLCIDPSYFETYIARIYHNSI